MLISSKGNVDLSESDQSDELQAASLIVTAAGDVNIGGRKVTLGNAAEIVAGGGVRAETTVLSAESISMKAEAGNIEASDARLTAENALTLTAAADLMADGATLDGTTVSLMSQSGAVMLENASISAQDRLAVSALEDVLLNETALQTRNAAISVTSTQGMVDLTANESSEPLLAASLGVSAARDVNLTSREMTLTGDAVITAGGGVLAEQAKLQAASITMSVLSGSIEADASRMKSEFGLSLAAKTEIGLSEASLVSKSAGAAVEAGGSIDARKLQASAFESLIVQAEGNNILRGAVLENGGALLLQAGRARVGEKSNVLDLTDVTDNSLGKNAFIGTSVTIETSGTLLVDDEPLSVKAADGDARVLADVLDLRTGTRVEALGGDAIVDAFTNLTAADNLSVTGENVVVRGGLENFEIGSNATFNATDGSVIVLGEADVTLGGQIFTNAVRVDSVSEDAGSVRIGAQGTLRVVDDAVAITANSGSVTVYGGKGMSIRNDLTIITAQDARLETGAGSLVIGNQATVKAGTQSGLAEGVYGAVAMLAGGSFEIGEGATVLADDLLVRAEGDVRFGKEAVLYGATDGVTVRSETGSIYMGEHLTVHSAADKTSFIAAEDIVVEREGTLVSKANEIEFMAARDVVFGDDFTAEGEGFVVTAQKGNVLVGDDAHVVTVFPQDSEQMFETAVRAGGSIKFGDRAGFDTTQLELTTESGDVVFGDDSVTQTSVYGIVVSAAGDVIYGKNALFGTSVDNLDADIRITAGTAGEKGAVTIGEGATVRTDGRVDIVALGDIDIGEGADIVGDINNDSSIVAIASNYGDINFGANASIEGYVVSLRAGDENLVEGGSVYLADKATVVTSDNFVAAASKDVFVEGDFVLIDGSVGDGGAGLALFKAATGSVVFADDAAFATSGAIRVEAGSDIRVGREAYLQSDPDDVTLAGNGRIDFSAEGSIVFEDGAVMLAVGDVRVGGKTGVSFADSTDIRASETVEITAQEGSVSFAGDAYLYGEKHLTIAAGDSVTIRGEAWIDSVENIEITAAGGDIVMSEAVRVGGVEDTTDKATTNVTLSAGGGVLQRSIVDGMGVTAETLTVRALEDVLLGAIDTGGEVSGNAVSVADIETGGSLALGLSYTPATVYINRSGNGQVKGSLCVHGMDSAVTIGNDIAVTGEVQIYAKSIRAGDITAGEGLYASTALYDATSADGIRVARLTAEEIGLMTGEGDLYAAQIQARQGRADIYRTGLGQQGRLVIGSGMAEGSATIFNANGAIDAVFISNGPTYVLTGLTAQLGNSTFTSASGRLAVIDHAQTVSYFLSDDYVAGHYAGEIDSSNFPRLDFFSYTRDILTEPSKTLEKTKELFEIVEKSEQADAQQGRGGVTDSWTREILSKEWHTGRGIQSMPHDLKL